MITRLLALALAAFAMMPAAVSAQPDLTLEQRMGLRCSAAFAIVAHGQSIGNERAQQYPPLEERGREYFVRVMAKLMDEHGLTREQISTIVESEAQALWDDDQVDAIMPSCLTSLEASGL